MEIGGTSMLSVALQGMRSADARMQSDVARLSTGDISPGRVVSLLESSFVYSMNIQLMKISDEMTGQIIDLLA